MTALSGLQGLVTQRRWSDACGTIQQATSSELVAFLRNEVGWGLSDDPYQDVCNSEFVRQVRMDFEPDPRRDTVHQTLVAALCSASNPKHRRTGEDLGMLLFGLYLATSYQHDATDTYVNMVLHDPLYEGVRHRLSRFPSSRLPFSTHWDRHSEASSFDQGISSEPFTHPEPELAHQILARHCVEALPLVQKIVEASAAEPSGPGWTQAVAYGLRDTQHPVALLRFQRSLRFLVEHGHVANSAAQRESTFPPLHACAELDVQQVGAMLPILLDFGADPTMEDSDGNTPHAQMAEGDPKKARWQGIVLSFQAKASAQALMASLR